MKPETRLIAPLMLLMVLLLQSGCISPAPVTPVTPVTPLTPVSTPPTTVFTPISTSQVTTTVTVAPGNPVPEETPIPMQAYVSRPYGLVQYEYNPAHKVRLLESHVETDTTGATMVVGTIKNIGTERIDLATVTISLFDADGNLIGSEYSDVYYLEPNRVWKFRTNAFTMSDFRTHQVAEIFTG